MSAEHGDAAARAARAHEPVAAIDLGTNTALLLVARGRADGSLETLEETCLTPRLGAGLAATGSLDAAASERAIEALRAFARTIARFEIPRARVRAVGTACLRRARDGRAFAARAASETGLQLEILSEEEEARLGEVAIESAGAGPDALVVDVGGGSTEIACRALGLRRSIPIGAVVLTETWLAPGVPDEARWANLRAAAATEARAFPADAGVGRPVWAIGGTAVNLGACAAGLARFDPRAVEGVQVPAARAGELATALALRSRADRLAFPIEAERADILPAGLATLAAVLERLGAAHVRVSGFGLRHGLAREALGS
ncbi:MAG: hypothetical protein NTY35_11920 [Planctomycetota bacterium]|nr:hypothetical protein [Planctomycetota bacterium]